MSHFFKYFIKLEMKLKTAGYSKSYSIMDHSQIIRQCLSTRSKCMEKTESFSCFSTTYFIDSFFFITEVKED